MISGNSPGAKRVNQPCACACTTGQVPSGSLLESIRAPLLLPSPDLVQMLSQLRTWEALSGAAVSTFPTFIPLLYLCHIVSDEQMQPREGDGGSWVGENVFNVQSVHNSTDHNQCVRLSKQNSYRQWGAEEPLWPTDQPEFRSSKIRILFIFFPVQHSILSHQLPELLT